jgi:hypothetical protein
MPMEFTARSWNWTGPQLAWHRYLPPQRDATGVWPAPMLCKLCLPPDRLPSQGYRHSDPCSQEHRSRCASLGTATRRGDHHTLSVGKQANENHGGLSLSSLTSLSQGWKLTAWAIVWPIRSVSGQALKIKEQKIVLNMFNYITSKANISWITSKCEKATVCVTGIMFQQKKKNHMEATFPLLHIQGNLILQVHGHIRQACFKTWFCIDHALHLHLLANMGWLHDPLHSILQYCCQKSNGLYQMFNKPRHACNTVEKCISSALTL